MDEELSRFVDGKRILAIEATPVPAPQGADHPGNHLFVNCLYNDEMMSELPGRILQDARCDVVAILRSLAQGSMLQQVKSVCMSFVCKAEHENGGIYRLYRFSILARDISADAALLQEMISTKSNLVLESSDHDEVAILLGKGKA